MVANLPQIDCGAHVFKTELYNTQTVRIPFNKKFFKAPIVAIGGSVGSTLSPNVEGGMVLDIDTSGFNYISQWEKGSAFTLYWIAVSL